LTTRPVAGVDWAIDTAFAYNKQLHPKTIPLLARLLKRRLAALPIKGGPQTTESTSTRVSTAKRPPRSEGKELRDYSGRRFA